MLDLRNIKKLAADAGFDLCGATPCRHLAQNEAWLRAWLAKGCHASLGYMERNVEKRCDPRLLLEGARTAVVCAVGYKNRASEGYPAGHRTKVASYACTRDYHTTIRGMLDGMLEALRRDRPGLRGRTFVDTAPLLEKQLAVEAGLGWIGRQSLLVTPRYGSYVLLGVLLLAEEADRYDAPFEGTRCGRCRNCIESCPAGAIVAERVIDATRCIACLTIEREPTGGKAIERMQREPVNREATDRPNREQAGWEAVDPPEPELEFGENRQALDRPDREQAGGIATDGWIFGCDRCQSCCPYNQKAPFHANPAFDPVFDPLGMDAAAWLGMDDAACDALLDQTPLTRSGWERIRRNVRRNMEE